MAVDASEKDENQEQSRDETRNGDGKRKGCNARTRVDSVVSAAEGGSQSLS